MGPEEAREEVLKRYPGASCCATVHAWYYEHSKRAPSNYVIAYLFGGKGCQQVDGDSFEECIKEIDRRKDEINAEIKNGSILFRKFG